MSRVGNKPEYKKYFLYFTLRKKNETSRVKLACFLVILPHLLMFKPFVWSQRTKWQKYLRNRGEFFLPSLKKKITLNNSLTNKQTNFPSLIPSIFVSLL